MAAGLDSDVGALSQVTSRLHGDVEFRWVQDEIRPQAFRELPPFCNGIHGDDICAPGHFQQLDDEQADGA